MLPHLLGVSDPRSPRRGRDRDGDRFWLLPHPEGAESLIRREIAVTLSLILALIMVAGCIAFGSSLARACLCIVKQMP